MNTLQNMTNIASQLNINDLKEKAIEMFNCHESYAGNVLNALLNALEQKLPESEFVEFCESI